MRAQQTPSTRHTQKELGKNQRKEGNREHFQRLIVDLDTLFDLAHKGVEKLNEKKEALLESRNNLEAELFRLNNELKTLDGQEDEESLKAIQIKTAQISRINRKANSSIP